jgi:hypothetical protein
MGEKNLDSQPLSKYEITFKGGIKVVAPQNKKDQIVKLWEEYLVTGKDTTIKFKNGHIIKASNITDIKPLTSQTTDTTARLNMSKINKILQEIPIKDERKKWWIDRIGENIKRKSGWIYYDKSGSEASQEYAKMSLTA